jgi:hypothetical protein
MLHEFFQILHAHCVTVFQIFVTRLPGLAVFHFLIWQVIASLYSAKSQAIALPNLTFCQAIALHNVSYKGHAQLNNVAFMGHYTLSCIITIIQVIVHIHDYNNLLYQN